MAYKLNCRSARTEWTRLSGPGGTIYHRAYVQFMNGLTIEELRTFLTKEFRTFVRDPEVYIHPVHYRALRD